VDVAGNVFVCDQSGSSYILKEIQANRSNIVTICSLPNIGNGMGFDKSGNLLVQSSDGPEGTVFSFRPGTSLDQITVLAPQANAARAGAAFVLPANVWDNGEFKDQLDPDTLVFKTNPQMFAEDVTAPRAKAYVSPDGSLVLPAYRVFHQGPPDHRGFRFSHSIDTHGYTIIDYATPMANGIPVFTPVWDTVCFP